MNHLLFLLSVLLSTETALAVVHKVYPSGGDDTATVQSALNLCTTADDCVIEFQPGIFRTKQVVVRGFRGLIRGAGLEASIVEPAGVLSAKDFDYTKPPATSNPYPCLWSFVDGSIRIIDLGFRVLTENPMEPYQYIKGWGALLDPANAWGVGWSSPTPTTHLMSLLFVTGARADLEIVRCSFEGAKGTYPELNTALTPPPPAVDRFNLWAGVIFWGIHPNRLEGGLQVSSSRLRNMMAGIVGLHLSNRRLSIGGGPQNRNEFDRACWAVEMFDLDGNALDISHNYFSQGCQDFSKLVWVEQVARGLQPASVRITRNIFVVNTGQAVSIADYIRDGVDGRSADFVIDANHIISNGNGNAVAVAASIKTLPAGVGNTADILVANNMIEGDSARYAIAVVGAWNATVVGNDVSGFKTTLAAPYLIQNSWSCILSGSTGSVNIVNNASTHTIVGVQRIN